MPQEDLLKFAATVNTGYLHSYGKKATLAFVGLLDLKDGEHILELGCGTGYTTMYVLDSKNVFIHAIETKKEMLEAAEKNARNFRVQDRTAFHLSHRGQLLSFDDETFDKVYWESVLAIQSTADFDTFLTEVYRVLKKGGLCVMNETIWLKGVSQQRADELNNYNEEHLNLRNSTQLPWNVEDWLVHFRKTGFEIIQNYLVSEMISANEKHLHHSTSFKTRLGIATWYSRAKKLLSPTHLTSHLRIKRKLQRYKNIEQVLEGRFFILKKPSGSSV